MSAKKFFIIVAASMLFVIGCDKEDDPTTGTGTLDFRFTVWNAEHSNHEKRMAIGTRNNIHTVELINVRQFIPKIEVTTDEIKEGMAPDEIDWFTIYESSEEMLNTDRQITTEIPAGRYIGFRITQRNLFYWVCLFQEEIIEFPSYNDSDLEPNDLLTNYLGEDGLYELEDGVFVLRYPDEKLGTFEILPDKNTRITTRINIVSIDWHDNDNSGVWSDGDELSNWSLPEGVTTMSDFIVEYE